MKRRPAPWPGSSPRHWTSSFKNAPAGSEAAVEAMKSAIASASSSYESAAKVAKELADTTQTNIESATALAVENLAKNTKAVASAVKSAS